MNLYETVKRLSVTDQAFYACIVLVALIEAWNGALAESPRMVASMPNLGFAPIWPFVPLVLLLVAGIIWIAKAIRAPTNPQQNPVAPLTEIRGRRYQNETIDLDGKRYLKCQFQGVTFNYLGGQYELIECLMTHGPSIQNNIRTTSLAVKGTVNLLASLIGQSPLRNTTFNADGTASMAIPVIIPIPAPEVQKEG